MKRVRARAYASIANLGYGFDVFAVCVTAGYDEVELVLGERGTKIEGDGARSISTAPRRNTASVALERLLRDAGVERRIGIRLRKGVPLGGGLGSSGASAVAAVVAADRLLGLRLSRQKLVGFAAHGETAAAGAAHADNVAASLFGGFVIVEKHDSERVLHLTPPRALRFVIATPAIALTTAQARRALPRRVPLADYSQGCARSGMIVAAIARGDVRELGRAIEGSPTDRARARLVPGFDDVCRDARAAGAAGATLSGAGPSVAAVVDADAVDPRRVAAAMGDAFGRAGLAAVTRIARVAGRARVIEARR